MLPDIVLFAGLDATNDSGLWETNGTGSGTAVTGAGASGIAPTSITVLGGQILFEGVNSSGDFGLWTTDGDLTDTVES